MNRELYTGRWSFEAMEEFLTYTMGLVPEDDFIMDRNGSRLNISIRKPDGSFILLKNSTYKAVFKTITDDRSLMLQAVQRGIPFSISHAADEIRLDREFAIDALKGSGQDASIILMGFCPVFEDDTEIVKLAMSEESSALQWASDRLREDIGMLTYVIESYGGKAVGVDSATTKEFVIKNIPVFLSILDFIPDRMLDDEEIIMAAVKEDGMALMWASSRLQDNEEIVREAIKECPYAIVMASTRIKNMPEFKNLY